MMTDREWKQFNEELDRRMDPALPYHEMVDVMINLNKDWVRTWLIIKRMLPETVHYTTVDAVHRYADRRYDELRKNKKK